jgi:hypothetical protein
MGTTRAGPERAIQRERRAAPSSESTAEAIITEGNALEG